MWEPVCRGESRFGFLLWTAYAVYSQNVASIWKNCSTWGIRTNGVRRRRNVWRVYCESRGVQKKSSFWLIGIFSGHGEVCNRQMAIKLDLAPHFCKSVDGGMLTQG